MDYSTRYPPASRSIESKISADHINNGQRASFLVYSRGFDDAHPRSAYPQTPQSQPTFCGLSFFPAACFCCDFAGFSVLRLSAGGGTTTGLRWSGVFELFGAAGALIAGVPADILSAGHSVFVAGSEKRGACDVVDLRKTRAIVCVCKLHVAAKTSRKNIQRPFPTYPYRWGCVERFEHSN